MHERHNLEQYFFDEPTINHLAHFVSQFENPCCVCAPLVGQALERYGCPAHVLDIDDRFDKLNGFRVYDICRPSWLGEKFGLILCDPPFFGVSLAQLFKVIRMLSHYDYNQPLLLCYLTRRSASVMRTFARFNLRPTAFYPQYQTVQKLERNDIELYGNLNEEQHQLLSRGQENLSRPENLKYT